jgi:glycosyltransferase involved in cell wall biosynthesis
MSCLGIITRTIDRPILLERTLRSILAQTWQDWEWIVVTPDPGPSVTPLLAKYAAELGSRVRVIPCDQSGPGMRGQPLNHAITHSSTEFITVLDDDDTWHPDFLSSMMSLLASPPGLLSGGAVCQTGVIEESPEADLPLRGYPLNPHIHAFVYRRSALALTGLYPEDYPVLEDWHFNLRFLQHYEIAVLPRILTYYHQRPGAAPGPEANSLFAELDLHKFYEARLINGQLRQDWKTGRPGPGSLLAAGAHLRALQQQIHQLESKIKTISEKTGKIDSRTQELKKVLLKEK